MSKVHLCRRLSAGEIFAHQIHQLQPEITGGLHISITTARKRRKSGEEQSGKHGHRSEILEKNIESDITVRLQAITQDKILHTGGDQGPSKSWECNTKDAGALCCYRLTLLEGEAGGRHRS